MKFILSLLVLLATAGSARSATPLVIAHRGASGYLPEHTLAAKAMAHAMGADFLEQDLVLTKDNVPIVLHDIHLDTVTNVARIFPERHRPDGHYYALDFTLAEIRQLQVSERLNLKDAQPEFPGRFPTGQSSFHISTLEEELQLVQGLNKSTGRSVGIYPELKKAQWHRSQGQDLTRAVLPILTRYGYAGKDAQCWLQSFELSEVHLLRAELGWTGKILLLLEGGPKDADGNDTQFACTEAGLKELSHLVDGIGPAFGSLITGTSPSNRRVTSLATRAHAHHLAVHAYTVRADALPKTVASTDDLHHLVLEEAQADGVFSDFPDLSVRWIHRAKGH